MATHATVSKEYRKLSTAFNANLRRVRGHAAAARMFMESGDLINAYREAERMQFAAFDAKDTVNNVLGNRLLTTLGKDTENGN